MSMYVISEDVRRIAERLKSKFPHNLSDANLERVVFLMELESPSKTKLAVTKKISPLMKAIHENHDYVQVYFQKRWENLNTAQKHILVMQQLMQLTLEGDKLRAYDVSDFYEICVAFGANWADKEDVQDPLAEDFNQVLQPKPVLEPDKYTEIMDDLGVASNISSQYNSDDEEDNDNFHSDDE